jgi:hypothetical protein
MVRGGLNETLMVRSCGVVGGLSCHVTYEHNPQALRDGELVLTSSDLCHIKLDLSSRRSISASLATNVQVHP